MMFFVILKNLKKKLFVKYAIVDRRNNDLIRHLVKKTIKFTLCCLFWEELSVGWYFVCDIIAWYFVFVATWPAEAVVSHKFYL